MKSEKQSLEKLPKWAQEHIQNLQHQRDEVVRELQSWVNGQKPSKIYIDELVCDGEETGPSHYRRFVQSRKVTMGHAGVEASLYAMQPGCIEVRFSRVDGAVGGVVIIPRHQGSIELYASKEFR